MKKWTKVMAGLKEERPKVRANGREAEGGDDGEGEREREERRGMEEEKGP